jgi:hypothetical protein
MELKTRTRQASFASIAAALVVVLAILGGLAGTYDHGAEGASVSGTAPRMSTADMRKCANSLLRYPLNFFGQVANKGTKLQPLTELTALGSAQCLRTAKRNISIWANMENNRHKMKRNTEVRNYDADPEEFFIQPQKPYDMIRRYTCERGKGKRQVRMVAKITVSFPGHSRSYTRKHRANGNKYDPWESGLTKPC